MRRSAAAGGITYAVTPTPRIVVVGAGPAGLMAAEVIAGHGLPVRVFDAMPSVGRKFLMAGKGGMNITHSEAMPRFLDRYGAQRAVVADWLQTFGPDALREWVHGLGITTFVGSSGRVFPQEMKAAPLLRAWLHRLRQAGVQFAMRQRWCGWSEQGDLRFSGADGVQDWPADAVVLALGGGSWARLGSDGAWVPLLQQRGVAVTPLQPANGGFECDWSAHFRQRFAGQPLKNVALSLTVDHAGQRGECLITEYGIEGGLIYAASAQLRDALATQGQAGIYLDLCPDKSRERLQQEIAHPRGARSLSSHLQSRSGITGVKMGLLRECLDAATLADPTRLAAAIKCLPLRLLRTRPLDEAISSAGGVAWSALNPQLMLHACPGVFCAGEMLDWEAPTGGYLLTACFASGVQAGRGVVDWLADRSAGNPSQ